MAKVSGNLGKQEFAEARVIDRTHDPIVIAGEMLADQGELPAGLILARNGDDKFIPFDPSGSAPANEQVAVLVEAVDTGDDSADNTVGRVLLHGTVVKKALKVGATDPAEPTDAEVRGLEPWIVAL